MQYVLYTPKSADCLIFYKRKFNVYDFNIYEKRSENGYCYLWDECHAKGGSNEIEHCLLDYCKQMDPAVKTITGYSDTSTTCVKIKTNIFWQHLCMQLNIQESIKSIKHQAEYNTCE